MATIQNEIHKCKTGRNVTIRSATAEDAAKVLELANEVFRTSEYLVTTPEEFASYTEEMQAQRIQKYEDSPKALLIVAEVDGQIIGMLDFEAGARNRLAHAGKLGISIHSKWRNQGIGRLMLSSLIHWAEHHPVVEVLKLTVAEDNASAIKLYKSVGFEITGREPFDMKLPDGKYLVNLNMTLKL